ncbi:MAG: T9SS type A sorting domain-containing protein [Dinghuibacter sp.]|nr:T9SS type A sorting domain-containing protein [Dinghuibacter sp.]
MKKKLLIALFLLIGYQVLADGTYKKRNNCWGFISWRFKVTANAQKVTDEPFYTGSSCGHGTCNSLASCTATGTYGWGEQQLVAFVTSKIGPGVPGQVSTWQHFLHIGKFYLGATPESPLPAYPYNALYQPDSVSPIYTGYGSTVSTADIVFDSRSHSIVLQGINGTLGVDVPDMANAYTTIKIWILDARNVKDEKDARVITSMQAMVINGQLVVQGGFSASDFQQPTRNKAQYNISNITKTIPIDPSISLDDIIVEVGSDAGALSDGIAAKYQPDFNTPEMKRITEQMQQEAIFKLNILQNPVSNKLNLSIANGQNHYNNVTVSILSASGDVVKEVYSGKMPEESAKNITVDVSALKPGIYYLTAITGNRDRFTRKFVKQ